MSTNFFRVNDRRPESTYFNLRVRLPVSEVTHLLVRHFRMDRRHPEQDGLQLTPELERFYDVRDVVAFHLKFAQSQSEHWFVGKLERFVALHVVDGMYECEIEGNSGKMSCLPHDMVSPGRVLNAFMHELGLDATCVVKVKHFSGDLPDIYPLTRFTNEVQLSGHLVIFKSIPENKGEPFPVAPRPAPPAPVEATPALRMVSLSETDIMRIAGTGRPKDFNEAEMVEVNHGQLLSLIYKADDLEKVANKHVEESEWLQSMSQAMVGGENTEALLESIFEEREMNAEARHNFRILLKQIQTLGLDIDICQSRTQVMTSVINQLSERLQQQQSILESLVVPLTGADKALGEIDVTHTRAHVQATLAQQGREHVRAALAQLGHTQVQAALAQLGHLTAHPYLDKSNPDQPTDQ